MFSLISRTAVWVTEGIKITRTWRTEQRPGFAFWHKRRRSFAMPLLLLVNAFFRRAKAPVQVLADPAEWRAWERRCFQAVHSDFPIHPQETQDGTLLLPELPGQNLTECLDGGTMTPHMAQLAGEELRRAHACREPGSGRLWSHGDPHAGNFILAPAGARAWIIDFEVQHAPSLPDAVRHLDDVAVFLQDVAGRIAKDRWAPCAAAFLSGYGAGPELLLALAAYFEAPQSLCPWIWWKIRLTFLSEAECRRRFAELAQFYRDSSGGGESGAAEVPALGQESALRAMTHSSTG